MTSMSIAYRLVAWFPTLLLARRNFTRGSTRSALAVAAVVIGVVAIGAIGVGGEAFKQDQLAAYEGFGGTATVEPVFYPDEPGPVDDTFTDAEIDRMRQAAPGATILPVVAPGGSLVRTATGEVIVTAQVKGLGNPGAFYEAEAGTVPSNWRRSVLVGARVADQHDIEVGDRITVGVGGEFERTLRVAAVLEPQGLADPLNADQSVFVPLSEFGDTEYDEAIVQVDPTSASIDAVSREIESELNTRRRIVSVEPVQEQREQFEQLFGTINQFLIGVGAISLLVAAVTIANTMLMASIEREGEIGLLRAVGYGKATIAKLIVAEALIIGLVGALVGAVLALGIGAGINQLLIGDPTVFTATGLRYIGVGVAFGIVVALLAGVYPAWKAASKPPVEALD